jgi:hypothetical protein
MLDGPRELTHLASFLARAVSEFLNDNRVKPALEASRADPTLTTSQRGSLAAALRAVTTLLDKVPIESGVVVHKPVTLYLKTVPSRPSYGTLHLDLNGTTTTVADLLACVAELLQHPVSALSLETQAGKEVVSHVHHDWTIASVSRGCVLNAYVQTTSQ